MAGWFVSLMIASALLAHDSSPPFAEQQQPVPWLTGKDLVKASTTPSFSITWMEAELGSELEMASRNTGIAVWIDRRLDPGQKISFSLEKVSFEQFLWRVADQSAAGVIRLGDVYYMAPPSTIATIQQRLETLKLQIRQLARNSELRRGMLTRIHVRSELQIEPRELIGKIFADCKIPEASLATIPHDLWSPVDLPEMEAQQVLSILSAGFDLETVISSDSKPEFAKSTQPESTEYLVPEEVLERVSNDQLASMNGIVVSKRGREVTISGKPAAIFSAMRELAMSDRKGISSTRPGSREEFSLHQKASRGDIAATVAQSLGLRLVFTDRERRALVEIIEINVDKVAAEEVLDACLKGSGLIYSISGADLRIETGK